MRERKREEEENEWMRKLKLSIEMPERVKHVFD